MIIDLASGATRPPARGEVFWCGEAVNFQCRESYQANGESTKSRRGGTLIHPCAADGSPTDATPQHLARSLGATVGDRTIVAGPDGLVAYDRAGG